MLKLSEGYHSVNKRLISVTLVLRHEHLLWLRRVLEEKEKDHRKPSYIQTQRTGRSETRGTLVWITAPTEIPPNRYCQDRRISRCQWRAIKINPRTRHLSEIIVVQETAFIIVFASRPTIPS